MAVCDVCFHHCHLEEGKRGLCGVRICLDGEVRPYNYGKITSLALDPIEKKPLNRFYPGSRILSIGSFGCNLRCPFCQNHEISWSKEAFEHFTDIDTVSPEELLEIGVRLQKKGNIGIAFTYNEPLIGYEYVRDTAKLFKENGMKTVLVSNGTAEIHILRELLPYIDAMNIDLKGFTDHYYRDVLKGDLDQVRDFISEAVRHCHVELTTLVVPGENDSEEEMREIAGWIADLKDDSGETIGENVPLHISRFFPAFRMRDREATSIRLIYHLRDVAKEKLNYVYTGNC
ncbi:MAG: AmmeMemoRadiSam system radical SAM enzyme [Erysipelotrichaceae bacterium]|nr:AmmeMemoRadiSam system radical SAM enzyme [Erysipelotrichaceae bacterium]